MVTSPVISKWRSAPFGVLTLTSSPSSLLRSARPIGDAVEISPSSTLASSGMTSWYTTVWPLSSASVTVDPKPTLSFGILSRFINWISDTRFWSSEMRDSTRRWRSLAAWYSAFSRRSPSSRARLISLGSSVFSSLSSCAISSSNFLRIRSFTPGMVADIAASAFGRKARHCNNRGGDGAHQQPAERDREAVPRSRANGAPASGRGTSRARAARRAFARGAARRRAPAAGSAALRYSDRDRRLLRQAAGGNGLARGAHREGDQEARRPHRHGDRHRPRGDQSRAASHRRGRDRPRASGGRARGDVSGHRTSARADPRRHPGPRQ